MTSYCHLCTCRHGTVSSAAQLRLLKAYTPAIHSCHTLLPCVAAHCVRHHPACSCSTQNVLCTPFNHRLLTAWHPAKHCHVGLEISSGCFACFDLSSTAFQASLGDASSCKRCWTLCRSWFPRWALVQRMPIMQPWALPPLTLLARAQL